MFCFTLGKLKDFVLLVSESIKMNCSMLSTIGFSDTEDHARLICPLVGQSPYGKPSGIGWRIRFKRRCDAARISQWWLYSGVLTASGHPEHVQESMYRLQIRFTMAYALLANEDRGVTWICCGLHLGASLCCHWCRVMEMSVSTIFPTIGRQGVKVVHEQSMSWLTS